MGVDIKPYKKMNFKPYKIEPSFRDSSLISLKPYKIKSLAMTLTMCFNLRREPTKN